MTPSTPGDDGSRAPGTDALFGALYQELHRVAARSLHGQSSNFSLGTTTLVHEAFLRFGTGDKSRFPNREAFFAYASRAMRSVLIDYARARQARKRGSEFILVGADHLADAGAAEDCGTAIEDLAAGLDQLDTLDPALSQLVDLHSFAGFKLVEIAAMRGVSERTVQRDWQKALLLLRHALAPHADRVDGHD